MEGEEVGSGGYGEVTRYICSTMMIGDAECISGIYLLRWRHDPGQFSALSKTAKNVGTYIVRMM